MPITLRILADADAVAAAAADAVESVAAAGGHVALAGGASPRGAYARLAARGADLGAGTLWFSDDRAVDPADFRSNYRMAAEALLDALPEPRRPRVHRVEGELGAEAAAARYEALVRAELGEPAAFDLVLLGLGPDAHTASLFPGKPALDATDRLVVDVPEAGLEPFVPRVTFTFALIARARRTVLLAAGAGKAEAVARAFGRPVDPEAPAGRLTHAEVLLDPAAAAGLDG